jgi:hypothetical protein
MDFCSPLELVLHSIPPVEVFELRASSPALLPLLCSLKNHDIIGSALPARKFLVVDLFEYGHLLVVGGPVVFQVLWSSLTIWLDGVVVVISYVTLELRFGLGVAFNGIHRGHQSSMNL